MDRLAGRRIRLGLVARGEIVTELIAAGGTDVTLGAGDDALLRVPGWEGPNLLLIAHGRWLHLARGMSMLMGEPGFMARDGGTYDELEARGTQFPMYINVAMLNLRPREGVTVLVKYLRDGEER